jgi:hypothetical protein
MKKIKFLIFFIALGSCSNLKYIDEFDGHKNNPSKVESTTYSIKHTDGVTKEDVAFGYIHFYDSIGRRLKRQDFKSDGTSNFGDRIYAYDKYGNRIQENIYRKDGSMHLQINQKYNKFGQQIESEHIRSEKKTISKYRYDRKNKIKKKICTKDSDTIIEKITTRYDENWKQIESISYDKSCIQKSRIEFFYDNRGNQILSKWYNSKNEIYEYFNSTYNFNNDIIKTEKYSIRNGEPKLSKITEIEYKYDENGNWIEKKLIPNGKASYVTKREYKYVW